MVFYSTVAEIYTGWLRFRDQVLINSSAEISDTQQTF